MNVGSFLLTNPFFMQPISLPLILSVSLYVGHLVFRLESDEIRSCKFRRRRLPLLETSICHWKSQGHLPISSMIRSHKIQAKASSDKRPEYLRPKWLAGITSCQSASSYPARSILHSCHSTSMLIHSAFFLLSIRRCSLPTNRLDPSPPISPLRIRRPPRRLLPNLQLPLRLLLPLHSHLPSRHPRNPPHRPRRPCHPHLRFYQLGSFDKSESG